VAENPDYVGPSIDVVNSMTAIQLLLRLGRAAEACAVLEGQGFFWSDDGFARWDKFLVAVQQVAPCFSDTDGYGALLRLILLLASPQSATLDAEASTWIPAPAAMAHYERNMPFCQSYLLSGIVAPAASAYLRLGRDDDAAEAARILVSPEHGCTQPSDFAHGHGVLGQVAAKRGDAEAADGHFRRALEVAAASRFPLLEVIAARDWKRAVPASGGAADAVISAACVKMGKSRAELMCGV
jgi:hypothetical protein